MKRLRRFTWITALLFTLPLIFAAEGKITAQQSGRVEFRKDETRKKIDVLIGGKLVTSYTWPENVYKPILYPVYTLSGVEVTRGFPLRPRAGERNDHIHQTGMWLNYGNVNGYDFWGNGSTGKRSENGGEIRHLGIEQIAGGEGEGIIKVHAGWFDPAGNMLLDEKTEYHFILKGDAYIIDRLTTLTATGNSVTMKDTKEGMFAIRVARQLELPSRENVPLLDATGKPGKERASDNVGVSGNYLSSEGVTGEAVWGTRARWMDLYGIIGNEPVAVIICDHPQNPSYPTYWHARGYGLFSANPLGGNDFTNGKEIVNFSIPAGKSVTFRYRTAIYSGHLPGPGQINDLADDFAGNYKN